VVDLCESKGNFQFVYEDKDTLWDKITDREEIYRASELTADGKVRAAVRKAPGRRLRALSGVRGENPVLLLDRCAAAGRPPANHVVNVREVRCAGPSSW